MTYKATANKLIILIVLICCFMQQFTFSQNLDNWYLMKSSEDEKLFYIREDQQWKILLDITDSQIGKEIPHYLDIVIEKFEKEELGKLEIAPYHIEDVKSNIRHIFLNPFYIDKVKRESNKLKVYWNKEIKDIPFEIPYSEEVEYILRRCIEK